MPRGKRNRAKDLIAELIQNELEANLAKMVRKAKKKANREADKLNELLRLEYHREGGFTEAEIIDEPIPPEEKKISGVTDGEEQ